MRRLILLAALALAACAGNSYKADIAALEVALTTADTAALAYVNLPTCAPGGPSLCSKPATVVQVGQAAATAYQAVKTAEAIANGINPNSTTLANAIGAAQAALGGFQAILSTLPKAGG